MVTYEELFEFAELNEIPTVACAACEIVGMEVAKRENRVIIHRNKQRTLFAGTFSFAILFSPFFS